MGEKKLTKLCYNSNQNYSGFAPSGLTETNRVMWMSDTGDHAGTVRWIGKIRDEFYAGVEFVCI